MIHRLLSIIFLATAVNALEVNNDFWKGWFHHEGYNPDENLNPPEMIARHGYPAESHIVQTGDGYLLTMHRIPCDRAGCKNGRGMGQPVYLQHGLLSSSADWLVIGPEKGLGYLLADAGYDVWMGNARGNTYSKQHVSLKNDDPKFWDFSWHEMALYDLPAQIDFIYSIRAQESNDTQTDLLYVGHSMGTTMFFAMLAVKPEYNNKVEAMFALAPVAYMTHVKSPIRLFAPFSKHIELVSKFLGIGEFLPQNWVLRLLAKYGCDLVHAEKIICENLIFIIAGFDKQQLNETLLPVILSHSPAGASTKSVIHYAQEIKDKGEFQYYDYGKADNVHRYGQGKPPAYDLDNIKIHLAFFYSDNDWLASSRDVKKLFTRLSQVTSVDMYRVPLANFNHVDFVWSKDIKTLLYDKLIESMKSHSANNV